MRLRALGAVWSIGLVMSLATGVGANENTKPVYPTGAGMRGGAEHWLLVPARSGHE